MMEMSGRSLIPVPVLYEDEDVFVFNKPAGLAVQGGKDVKHSLDTLLAERFSPRPLLVHRWDKDTSGAILVAKHKEAAIRFGKILRDGQDSQDGHDNQVGKNEQNRQIEKIYHAVCVKSPALKRHGVINDTLTVKGRTKTAATRYQKLAETDDLAFLEITLLTGRMHQIRRHLAALGAPVAGDDKYGDFRLNKKLKKEQQIKHLLLHAARITFPAQSGRMTVDAPLPPYFPALCKKEAEGVFVL
jgi:23S rRNA pseudouridine955/2504/2580 synthase